MQRLRTHEVDPGDVEPGNYVLEVEACGPAGAGRRVAGLVPAETSGGAAGAKVAALKYAGTLTVGAGQTRLYNDTGAAWAITSVRASVESPPVGGTVVVDVNVGGTTIFTTQANRPVIAASALTSGKVINMDVTTVPAAGYVTVDVDTTTSPAANLTVLIGLI